jgi:hypothetical protein
MNTLGRFKLLTCTLANLSLTPIISFGASNLNVTDYTGSDGVALVNNILGPGFSLVGTPSYVGGSGQAGFFTGGAASGITIDKGILLTSGKAQNAVGPNNSPSTSYSWGTAGDANLNTLSGQPTHDANTLTFTFHAATDGHVHFNYVFGSEEYNEYVGTQFNDVFGFFLDGGNVALIPSTTTAVSINTVNLGLNSAYYINNGTSVDPHPAAVLNNNIQYDGFTVALSVDAAVTAGDHTIELAIADASDTVYDSGVFIQSGSFSSNPTNPAPDGGTTLALLGMGFAGLAVLRNKFARN